MKNKVIINYKKIGWFCLLILMIEPTYFSTVPILDLFYNVFWMINIIIAIVINIQSKLSKMLSVCICYYFWLILVTIFGTATNLSNIQYVIKCAGIAFALISYIDLMCDKDVVFLISSLAAYLRILVYANFILMILFPNGLYSIRNADGVWHTDANWLLGYKNAHIYTIMPAIMLSVIYDFMKYGKYIARYRTLIFVLISIVSVIMSDSSTSLVFIAMIVLFFIISKLKLIKKVHFVTYCLISGLLFLLIIINRKQDIFAYIIENLLHRNLTFSSRTGIWDSAIYYINQRILCGYGIEKQLVRILKFRRSDAVTCHNQILEIMYTGGIILLIIFLIILFLVGMKLMKYKTHPVAIWISWVIFSLFIMYQMEAHFANGPLDIAMLSIAYNIDKIISLDSREKIIENQKFIT